MSDPGYEICTENHLGIQSEGPKDCRSSAIILRPKSPTESSVNEISLLLFVEDNFKDSFIDNICPWKDIVCAFSAPFLFRKQTGASIPNVNMQMYWCNFCVFKSQEKCKMVKHSMTHRFKCNDCDKESFCRIDIIKHSFNSHPEYKKIRKDLKACVLLGDFCDRDEMVMMSGSQNLDKELLNSNDRGRNLFDSHHSSLDPVCLTTTQMPIVLHDEQTSDATAVITANSVNSNEAIPMDTTCDTITIADKVNILQTTTPTIKLSPPHISDTEMTVTEIMEPSKETGLTELPQSVDPVFSPITTSVEMLRNDENQTISNLPPIDVITTVQPLVGTDLPVSPINKDGDITIPSMPVLKRTKGGKASDSDRILDDDNVDPDYIPEAKYHKKSKTQNPKRAIKAKTKTNSEKILAHQKQKHKGKPPKCLSVISSKDGEIVQVQSKADQVSKVTSPLKSPIPSLATSESATKTISGHNKNKAASESISDPKDARNKKDLRYSCMFCDHKYNDMYSMRQHMFKLHSKEKFCCVDRILKGRGKDYYWLFCCRHKCNFFTVKPKDYLEHVERCTPVRNVDKEGKNDKPTGLQQTCLFVEELLDEKSPSSNKNDNREKESKEMKVKTSYTKPDEKRLYSCHRCDFSVWGNEAMKAHMIAKHPNLTMIALFKNSDSTLDFYFFCPEFCCPYTTQRKPDLEKHRQEKHQVDPSKPAIEGIEDDKKDIKLIPKMKSENLHERRTMLYMPSYMCLYCETSCITTSLANMKRHVQESHPDKTIIVRDCVAHKRNRPSRIYVCDHTGCLFNDIDYKEYLTHICAHKNSCLYECSSCSSWVSLDEKDFIEHIKKDETSKHSLVRLNVSMTADGSVVKRISAQQSS